MSQPNILEVPGARQHVRFAAGFGQRFVVTVDTEEEFDWTQPLGRTGHGLSHVPWLARFQQFCEGMGVAPVYLLDYPIATDPAAVEALGEAVAAGRAEIGIQLHPWVSPPHDEEVNVYNSFAGNLPPELEAAKFNTLKDAIENAFGKAPLIYRAGRYGIGPASAGILSAAGIAIDTSVRARFDYSSTGGPNFREHPVVPWWVDQPGGLMELPLTTVFWGMLRQQGPLLYPALWRTPKLRGLLARMAMLERIPLTPEGVSIDEAVKGIDIALDDGLPILVFSFHSPSLRPGLTPYVRDADELDRLYDWWRAVFSYLKRRDIRPASVAEIMAAVVL
ncbi:MAG: polysaccharide deacetylase family protein [Sphingomonadales bacterium]|uniref:polysaccharide deacetylase family protein n=1 Tax=Novosphingobium sp. AAP93 TaxID=1523427 RepID=UPI0006BA0AF4|nr:polysaccharide deacetylase family protein [Novosphingobium sp. AAP93]KPF82937.1 WalW protein [Novosphingobium sp. AAP93]MBU6394074.1 polysaccharide deacetylase family protein [Sphingomonadales bacterium]